MLTTLSFLEFADNYSEFDFIVLGSIIVVLNIDMYLVGPIFLIKKICKRHMYLDPSLKQTKD